jgi:hypothetical protein
MPEAKKKSLVGEITTEDALQVLVAAGERGVVERCVTGGRRSNSCPSCSG